MPPLRLPLRPLPAPRITLVRRSPCFLQSVGVVAATTTTTTSAFSTTNPRQKQPLPPKPPLLPEEEIEETFVKGSGPGGQKINKTNSAVQLRHKPTGVVVKCQETRSQPQNRIIARSLLASRVDEFRNGDQSRAALVAEIQRRKRASALKKSRRKYRKLEDERSEEKEVERSEEKEVERSEVKESEEKESEEKNDKEVKNERSEDKTIERSEDKKSEDKKSEETKEDLTVIVDDENGGDATFARTSPIRLERPTAETVWPRLSDRQRQMLTEEEAAVYDATGKMPDEVEKQRAKDKANKNKNKNKNNNMPKKKLIPEHLLYKMPTEDYVTYAITGKLPEKKQTPKRQKRLNPRVALSPSMYEKYMKSG